MKKTVCELFAGVGGFRCGLNSIKTIEDASKKEKWKTVWFSQWEPADKKIQWAHDCYVNRFGTCLDLNGNDTTNNDINTVDKNMLQFAKKQATQFYNKYSGPVVTDLEEFVSDALKIN